VQDVPGIGPARVRAYHARGDELFGPPSGIFLAAPECGTAAHELVHARAAEENLELPLWLEEGVACLIGDGFLEGDRWVVDGLSCWPLRELQNQTLPDADLARILSPGASDPSSPRETCSRTSWGRRRLRSYRVRAGSIGRAGASGTRRASRCPKRVSAHPHARPGHFLAWMERLRDPRREVHLATAKGV
jgi:hypothetical protein